MTLAVTVVCQDGVVVAADSRTTLANRHMLRVGSDFTHKVFESGGVAVATYGEAFVADRSIASHMAEFAVVEAGNCDHPGPTAGNLAAFFGDRYDAYVDELPDDHRYFAVQKIVNAGGAPSEQVIEANREKSGREYRDETEGENPVVDLRDPTTADR